MTGKTQFTRPLRQRGTKYYTTAKTSAKPFFFIDNKILTNRYTSKIVSYDIHKEFPH